ncbi:sigma-54 interaction domain-containing protein [Thalassobaculum salexigens]|uniref:sigma-54 interaction domain-containing protein n=1 Tax=Thalassobaculum salexigens TaxID=455360 RepID=UPI00248D517B|nr:sigma 54-interacting transcriptional regulator [Thalassobaculum salexigens]
MRFSTVRIMDTSPSIRLLAADGTPVFTDGPRLPDAVDRALTAADPDRRIWSVDLGDTVWSVLSCHTASGVALHLVWPAGAEDPVVDFAASVDFAHEILAHFLTNPYEAITVVDAEGLLRWVSPVHAKFFGMKRGEGLGLPAEDVIENTRLPEVAKSGRAQIGRLQEMNGVARIVSRFPINRDDRTVGAIGQVMFKGPDQALEFGREIAKLRAEVDYYRRELEEMRPRPADLEAIIGDSPPIRKLKADIARVAPLDISVLIRGESGTGKELVARALHGQSNRAAKPLVVLNAAALPATLVEAELFGYEPGSFTGADKRGRSGKFELADKGTLFLDEIGDMGIDIQAKVLRVLEEGTFERLGGHRSRSADFRLVTATNRPVERMIEAEDFRADLYFRIGALTLWLPPLRDRAADIPALVRTFLARTVKRHNLPSRGVRADAMALLAAHSWPGNVRELFNTVQKAAIFCEGDELTPADLPDLVGEEPHPDPAAPLEAQLRALEERLIAEALDRADGNKKRAAEALGISRTYLYKRLGEMSG